MTLLKTLTLTLTFSVLSTGFTKAQNEESQIAQKLQNPLARMSALPIQHNIGNNSPAFDGSTYTMSFQPFVGTEFENFNIIHRAVFGASYLPSTYDNPNQTYGVTDLNYSFYYAPKTIGKVAWGIGPSVDIPTASHHFLGSGKWSAGASMVLVYQTPKWTFDLVFRQTASFAGEKDRRGVNQFVAQPLVAYNLGKGWVVNTFPTIQGNWSADKGQQWTIPLGGGFTKVMFLGNMPVALGAQYYNNAVRPDNAPKSELRFSTAFVFSK